MKGPSYDVLPDSCHSHFSSAVTGQGDAVTVPTTPHVTAARCGKTQRTSRATRKPPSSTKPT